MAPNEKELGSVYKWLETTQHVLVNREWLEACITWVKEEQSGHRLSLQQLVFEQWLMSDLSECGMACLPEELNVNTKGNVKRILALQMNSIIDVGASAYTQWKKIKGEDVTPSQENLNKFQQQQKPSRLLKMELTDGYHTIHAIEYKPLPSLHVGLPPGIKVLVKGGLVFRRGIIFLMESNIKILGGHVDGLLEQNSQKNILYGLAMRNASAEQLARQEMNKTLETGMNTDGATRSGDVVHYDNQGENKENIPHKNTDMTRDNNEEVEFLDDNDDDIDSYLTDVELDRLEGQAIAQDVFQRNMTEDNFFGDDDFETDFIDSEQNMGEEFFNDQDVDQGFFIKEENITEEFFDEASMGDEFLEGEQRVVDDFLNDGTDVSDDVLNCLMDNEEQFS